MNNPINSMTDRAAMGLPEHMTQIKTYDIADTIRAFKNYTEASLVDMIANLDASFYERYAAGSLLGLLGDPRISVFAPEMIIVPSARACIGISESAVNKVLTDYAQVNLERAWILKETPQFTVDIKAFNLAKYPVTNQEYYQFLLNTSYPELPTSWSLGIYPHHKSNCPVYSISDDAAVAYTKWLSICTGCEYRLPTEYEWEYAAGGIEHYEYPWGNSYQMEHANTVEEAVFSTTPIGMYPKGYSPFGIADLAGNVEEFVSDFYRPYPGGSYVQDDLAVSGSYRIARGGSFARYGDLARTSRRHGNYRKPIYAMGFRLAQDLAPN